MNNRAISPTGASIFISLLAGVSLSLHVTKAYVFDDAALILLGLAMVPWLIVFAQQIEMPRRLENTASGIREKVR